MKGEESIHVLRVHGRLHWGYSIRTPTTSAAEFTLLVPPPSSLIGALGRGLATVLKLAELISTEESVASGALHALNFTRAASFSYPDRRVGPVAWRDISRVSASPYLQQKYRKLEAKDMWFGIHATGRVYAPNSPLRITYIIEGRQAERSLGEEWRETLRRSAWCITAIGGKEGMISVDDVKLSPVLDMKKKGVVVTRDYFPEEASAGPLARIAKPRKEQFWDFSRNSGHWRMRGTSSEEATYVLPMEEGDIGGFRPVEVMLSPKGAAVTDDSKVGDEKEYTVLLSEWLT